MKTPNVKGVELVLSSEIDMNVQYVPILITVVNVKNINHINIVSRSSLGKNKITNWNRMKMKMKVSNNHL